ncbi:MAG: DUF6498-containing protein [Candidatus Shapirobacteria bacterium]
MKNLLAYPSALVLIISNFIPLWGVLNWGWDSKQAVIMYWSENLIIGFFTLLKMRKVIGETDLAKKKEKMWLFLAHFGGFCLGHGVFILILLFGPTPGRDGQMNLEEVRFWEILPYVRTLTLAFGAAFMSHAFSYWQNYIGREEYTRSTLDQLFWQPYFRVIVVHLTIFGVYFLSGFMENAQAGAVALVFIKTIVDTAAHLAERYKFREIKTKWLETV